MRVKVLLLTLTGHEASIVAQGFATGRAGRDGPRGLSPLVMDTVVDYLSLKSNSGLASVLVRVPVV